MAGKKKRPQCQQMVRRRDPHGWQLTQCDQGSHEYKLVGDLIVWLCPAHGRNRRG